jgi:vacuolar-type H+-ATPase subunit F/Vma7
MPMPEGLSLQEPFAIIGYEDAVSGFKSLGFKVYALKEKNDYGLMIGQVASADTAVCLIQDEVYRQARALIEKYDNLPFPIFLPFSKDFPPKQDQLDGMLKDIRRRATGKI